MRLLFPHPNVLTPGNHHGAIKSYRAMVAALAASGHACEVVTGSSGARPDGAEWTKLCSVKATGIEASPIRFVLTEGATTAGREFLGRVRRRIVDFNPDWVICENGVLNLRVLSALARNKLVLSVSTAASLPFGPFSAAPWWSTSSRGVYLRIPKIFCASRFIRDTLRRQVQIEVLVQPQVGYGMGPFTQCARFDDGVITMVNPTAHKGGSIFAGLASAFPHRRFRAIESYARVVPRLFGLPNVEIVPANDDLDRVLAGTQVLLVPSMWGEGWGMACVDAMLRGIPVLASDDGGLREATLGVGKCIPITPGRLKRKWSGELDFREPRLDSTPWKEALDALAGDRRAWENRSDASRVAAIAYVEGLSVDPLSRYLSD